MSRLIGSILLIAGCSIGAGMLGIPVVTGPFGFLPTLLCFVFAWAYMCSNGILYANIICDLDEGGRRYTLMTMSEYCFGKVGKWIVWGLFGFLFYAVLTAYLIGCTQVVRDVWGTFSLKVPPQSLIMDFVFISLFLALRGTTHFVDIINRWLMIGLFCTYFVLIFMSVTHVHPSALLRAEWQGAFKTLPILVFSFGFHNLIPTIVGYLQGNRQKVYKAILVGSFLPLLFYVVWEMVILGLVTEDSSSIWSICFNKGELATTALAQVVHIPSLVLFALMFAFFALATSFLSVGISFVDSMQDALHKKGVKTHHTLATVLCLIPSFIIAQWKPTILLQALCYSGGVLAMLLFGIIPALCLFVVSAKRHIRKRTIAQAALAFLGAVWIIWIELFHQGC